MAPAQNTSIHPPNSPAAPAAKFGYAAPKKTHAHGSSSNVGNISPQAPSNHRPRSIPIALQIRGVAQAINKKLAAYSTQILPVAPVRSNPPPASRIATVPITHIPNP